MTVSVRSLRSSDPGAFDNQEAVLQELRGGVMIGVFSDKIGHISVAALMFGITHVYYNKRGQPIPFGTKRRFDYT